MTSRIEYGADREDGGHGDRRLAPPRHRQGHEEHQGGRGRACVLGCYRSTSPLTRKTPKADEPVGRRPGRSPQYVGHGPMLSPASLRVVLLSEDHAEDSSARGCFSGAGRAVRYPRRRLR